MPLRPVWYPGLGLASAAGCRFWVLVLVGDVLPQLGPPRQRHPTPWANTKRRKKSNGRRQAQPLIGEVGETIALAEGGGGPYDPPLPIRPSLLPGYPISAVLSFRIAGYRLKSAYLQILLRSTISVYVRGFTYASG